MSSTQVAPTCHVMPWDPKTMDPALLTRVYAEIYRAGLIPEIFHEKELNCQEFFEFVASVIFSVCWFGNDLAGFGWIGDLSQVETHLRGWAGYALLPQFWNAKLSLEFGKLGVGQWFNPQLHGLPWKHFDLVMGLTPAPNRLSRLWSTRLGFRYLAKLPGYTSYHGKRVDGMICQMSREEFNRRWKISDE